MKREPYVLCLAIILFAAVLIAANVCVCTKAEAEIQSFSIAISKDSFKDSSGTYDYWGSALGKTLYVGYVAGFGSSRTAMGFNLSGANLEDYAITAIKLRFLRQYCTGTMNLTTTGSNNDTWSESSGPFPALSGSALASHNIGGTGWIEIGDLKDFILAEYQETSNSGSDIAQYATLVLTSTSTTNNVVIYACEHSSANKPSLVVYYGNPSVSISATQAVTEANVESTDIHLVLNEETFNTTSLSKAMFTLNDAAIAQGAAVDSVTYVDDNHATLRLSCADPDIHFGFDVTVNGATLSTGTTITSNTINARAVYEITSGGTYNLDEMGTEADIVISTTQHVRLTQTSDDDHEIFHVVYSVAGADLELDDARIPSAGGEQR